MVKKTVRGLLLLLLLWLLKDFTIPRKTDFRNFDPVRMGQVDAAMWQAYYEKKPFRLFLQLARSLRGQFNAPFWRSFAIAYHATKAAFVFKEGTNRSQYIRALPHLEDFYAGINQLNKHSFNVSKVAKNELEWWIIRREPRYSGKDWEKRLRIVSAAIYRLPEREFEEHANLRVMAMQLRDAKGCGITSADWSSIEETLIRSWTSLFEAVQ